MSATARTFAVAAGTFTDITELAAAHRGEATLVEVDITSGPLDQLLDGMDGLVVGLHPLGAEQLRVLPDRLRVIGRAGIGLDSIDLDAAREVGRWVIHQPDYATSDVADHTAALVLALNRRVVLGDRIARQAWPSLDRFASIVPLELCTLGVAGYGRIGKAVVERLTPFVGEVIVHDPYESMTGDSPERVSTFAELARRADILTLHMPLTASTRDLVDDEVLRSMKPSALLVNVSRGGLVDEVALARALGEGRLGGATLDVLSVEPPSPGHPLLDAPNTILTPHVAWLSTRGQARLQHWTVGAMLDVLAGRAPAHGRVAVTGSPGAPTPRP